MDNIYIEQSHSIIKFFTYEHLPAHLQIISKPFSELAEHIYQNNASDIIEKDMALRKLLEAKDCAVRAFLK